MSVEVKICGLRTDQAMAAALDAGADFVGLVFYEPSPRHVDLDTARRLAGQARGRARTVALMVDPDDASLDRIVSALEPDLVQLHGSEAPERVAEIRQRSGRPVIKAVRVGGAEDVEAARAYEKGADFILYDAKPPASATGALPGGNGVPFDWKALALASGGAPRTGFFLSGGLDPDNVAAAIRLTGAPIVDVSSGVETAPGEKDPELIRRFISAAKSLS